MSEKYSCAMKRNFCDCCRHTGHFPCGVERVKRLVNVRLHYIVSNLKRIRKMSMLPSLQKFLPTPISFMYSCALSQSFMSF